MAVPNDNGEELNEIVEISGIDGSEEVWRDIPGFEGYYRVSDRGNVRSVVREVMSGGVIRKRQSKQLAAKIGTRGYVEVALYKHSKPEYFTVHTLVLIAFVGSKPEGMECRHFPDPDRTNNNLENLCWGTRVENGADRITHGTQLRGSKVPSAKLTEEDVKRIKGLLRQGLTQVRIADMFGVTHRVIGRILHGQIWTHVE